MTTEIHVLQCKNPDHLPVIQTFVELAKLQTAAFVAPKPWEDPTCAPSATVFVATRPGPEIVGWALVYEHPIYRRAYVSSITTRTAKDPASYKGTGTLLMHRLLDTLAAHRNAFVYLLPIQQSEGFYRRFGFAPREGSLYYRALQRDPTPYEVAFLEALLNDVGTALMDDVLQRTPLNNPTRKRLRSVLSVQSKANEAAFMEILRQYEEDPDQLDEAYLRDVLRRKK